MDVVAFIAFVLLTATGVLIRYAFPLSGEGENHGEKNANLPQMRTPSVIPC